MKIKNLMKLKFNEKPLDNIVLDGGYTSIFNVLACVGDSLSSGEFESVNEKGEKSYHDLFEYSWGQYIARMAGVKVYNFSRGGMTTKEYLETYAKEQNFWDKEKRAKAYIIALGVNDIFNFNYNFEIGSVSDVDLKNYENNKSTFAGYYAQIIQRYKEIAPNAKFFLVSMPKECAGKDDKRKQVKNLLSDFTKIFDNTYLIDLYTYAPVYNEEFKKKFFLNGHMNPMGYKFTANLISSYVDYIVRKNFDDFKKVGFINYLDKEI